MAFRILSLDGGGSWALLQAKALLDLFGDRPGREILNDFDLVAANSGGSLVLGALVKDLRPSEIIQLFMTEARRKRIFSLLPLYRRLPNLFDIGSRYSTAAKLEAIKAELGPFAQTPMKDLPSPARLLIVGFDYDRERAEFFRSFNSGGGTSASTVHLADAIHASTNAPVNFFDEPTQCGDRRYWDGAVGGYNNPVMAAVVEAVSLGIAPVDIRALAIGTASVLRPIHPGARTSGRDELFTPRAATGLKTYILKLATAILDDPPDAASFVAYTILGNPSLPPPNGPASLIRLNPLIRPVLDPASGIWREPPGLSGPAFDRLAKMDMDAVDQKDVDLIAELGDQWLQDRVPNQPIRIKGDTLEAVIGHQAYSAAKAAWLQPVTPPGIA
jgi:hypothetical protein